MVVAQKDHCLRRPCTGSGTFQNAKPALFAADKLDLVAREDVFTQSLTYPHLHRSRQHPIQNRQHHVYPREDLPTLKMRCSFIALLFALFAAVLAIAPQKAVIITYPDDTPSSVINKAMDVIRDAGGVVTHEYSKWFLATQNNPAHSYQNSSKGLLQRREPRPWILWQPWATSTHRLSRRTLS